MEKKIFPEYIGEKLYDLVYFRQYLLNPGVVKLCFLESLKELGAEVICNDSSREAALITKVNLNPGRFDLNFSYVQNIIKYNNLGNGVGVYPKGSLNAFEEDVYNLWQPEKERFSNKDLDQFIKAGHENQLKFKGVMKKFLLPYLIQYQENMLISASGKIPRLDIPRIFLRITSRNRNVCTGKEFWAKYLDRLSREKGYPLKERQDNDEKRLEKLVRDGNLALEDGRRIWNTQII